MGATLEGTQSFNRYLSDLVYTVGGPGTHTDAAFRGEIGSLVRVCISYTPAAETKKIRERANVRFSEKYAIRGSGDLKVTMNDGSRGGEAVAENVWLRSGGKFYIMRGPGKWAATGKEKISRYSPGGAHWPDRIWQQYQALIDQTPEERDRLKKEWVARALASRGLAKASWAQMARDLGIPGIFESLPDYAQKELGSDGRVHLNGTGQKTSDQTSLTYTLQNIMPALALGGGLDGEGIASRAMAARETAFEIALDKGLTTDLEFLSRRYPGLVAS